MIMMRMSIAIACVLFIAILASCDVRSETAKRDMEKFKSAPIPESSPLPIATPVDPKDVVEILLVLFEAFHHLT